MKSNWVKTFLLALWVLFGRMPSPALAAQVETNITHDLHSSEPTEIINSTQRLAVEQVRALIDSAQWADAVTQLHRLREIPAAIVERDAGQAAMSQRVEVYQPLRSWCQQKLLYCLSKDKQLLEAYQQQWNALAEAAFRAVQRSQRVADAMEASKLYAGTSYGNRLAILWVDLLVESGDCLAAAHTLDANFPRQTRVSLRELDIDQPTAVVPWFRVWQIVASDAALSNRLLAVWQQISSTDPWVASEVLKRNLLITATCPEMLDLPAVVSWTKAALQHLPAGQQREEITALLGEIGDWPKGMAKSENSHHFALTQRPHWQQALERWSNSEDLTPASRPAVGQRLSAKPYFPQVYSGKVFLNELTRIAAYDLETGRTWPAANTALFDSHITAAAYMPLGYPLQGSPRAGLAIVDDCLYARMGSPVTGWTNRSRSADGGSISYLVGLDLQKQGSLLRGFPLRLLPPAFENSEFDGVPLVVGQKLLTTICTRDNVGVRRSLAAFDRFSGQLLWHTKALGAGVVVGSERANLISSTQPTIAGGLAFLSTDLGSIACVNLHNGQVVWQTRYQRSNRLGTEVLNEVRFRYRDGKCLVHRGLVYCLPQDCAELFALDLLTGDLVWSSSSSEVADCVSLLGVYGDSLIVSGDRIVWLDRNRGEVQSHYPAPATPAAGVALAQPRGLGQAALVDDRVYWPTADQVFVFAANGAMQTGQRSALRIPAEPGVLGILPTVFGGAEGGNLTVEREWLMYTTPGRLICFRADAADRSSQPRPK
jgi:outer membrane protein assembly factor BamB